MVISPMAVGLSVARPTEPHQQVQKTVVCS